MLSDESLLAGFAAKDPDTTTAFVRRFQGRVFGLALTIVRDPPVAEEIAQEVFVRAWQHAGTYDPRKGRVDTWLLTIARNAAVDARRLRGREVKTPPDALWSQILGNEPDPEESGLFAAETARLRRAIRVLPPDQQRVLFLAAFEGRSGREIGEAEGIPVGTVKTRLRAAMLKLRDAFEVDSDY